jgi:hypothetical protein
LTTPSPIPEKKILKQIFLNAYRMANGGGHLHDNPNVKYNLQIHCGHLYSLGIVDSTNDATSFRNPVSGVFA